MRQPNRGPAIEHLDKLNRLTESHGVPQPGKGMISGVTALALAILCFLGVLAFHFPEYLTTPQLRKSYNVDVMPLLMFWSMVLAGALALFNVVRDRARWLAFAAFVLIGLTLALGGHKMPVNDFVSVRVRLGPLRHVIVTPNFHHWTHSADTEAIDRNYAAHFTFLDHLFGTAAKADRAWPERYGVVGNYVPNGFFKQLAFPFLWKS